MTSEEWLKRFERLLKNDYKQKVIDKMAINTNTIGFKEGQAVRFKHGCVYLYGIIDNAHHTHCEVSYGSKKQFINHLKGFSTLDYFADVDNRDIELINKESLLK